MGLDMYLNAHKYIGGNFDHLGITGKISIERQPKSFNGGEDGEKTTLLELDDMSKVSKIIFHVGYWRKANQIHSWFVENCQEDKDECQEAWVSVEQLEELRDLCQEVKDTKDASLLEPVSGFFFGSTEVDEWYWQDIDETIKILTEALNNPLFEDCSFYYQSSW